MAYNFTIAKEVLSEVDKNRLVCCYLNCDPSAVNWAKATEEFGAASIESMKVMVRGALKKIEEAGGKQGVTGGNGSTTGTPGAKRKAKAGPDADDEEGAGSPKPKAKRGRKSKKDSMVPTTESDEAETKADIKAELDEDDFQI